MAKPEIPGMRTWPRNLNTSQVAAFRHHSTVECQPLNMAERLLRSMEVYQRLSMGECPLHNTVASPLPSTVGCQHHSMAAYLRLNMEGSPLRSTAACPHLQEAEYPRHRHRPTRATSLHGRTSFVS